MTTFNGQISSNPQIASTLTSTSASKSKQNNVAFSGVSQPKFGLISDELVDRLEDSIEDSGVSNKRNILGKLARFALIMITAFKVVNQIKGWIDKLFGGKNKSDQPEQLELKLDDKKTERAQAADQSEETGEWIDDGDELPPIRSIAHVRQVDQALDNYLNYYENEVGLDIDAPLETRLGDVLATVELPWNTEFIEATLFDAEGQMDEEAWVSRFNKANKTTIGSLSSNVTMRQMIDFVRALKREEAKSLQLVNPAQ